MDREALTKQVKDFKAKAKTARKGGNRKAAAEFSAGMKRAERRLAATGEKKRHVRGKKDE